MALRGVDISGIISAFSQLQAANAQRRKRDIEAKERRRAYTSGTLGALGTLAGGAVGGPVGATAGGLLGTSLGGGLTPGQAQQGAANLALGLYQQQQRKDKIDLAKLEQQKQQNYQTNAPTLNAAKTLLQEELDQRLKTINAPEPPAQINIPTAPITPEAGTTEQQMARANRRTNPFSQSVRREQARAGGVQFPNAAIAEQYNQNPAIQQKQAVEAEYSQKYRALEQAALSSKQGDFSKSVQNILGPGAYSEDIVEYQEGTQPFAVRTNKIDGSQTQVMLKPSKKPGQDKDGLYKVITKDNNGKLNFWSTNDEQKAIDYANKNNGDLLKPGTSTILSRVSDEDRVFNRKLKGSEQEIAQSKSNMQDILNLYKKDFLTYGGKYKAFVQRNLGRISKLVDPETGELTFSGSVAKYFTGEDPKYVDQFTQFMSAINSEFNQYRKDITGAQAGMKEIQFLKKAIFTSMDSPEQFEANVSRYNRLLNRKAEVLASMRRDGVANRGDGEFNAAEYDRRFTLRQRTEELIAETEKNHPNMSKKAMTALIRNRLHMEGLN